MATEKLELYARLPYVVEVVPDLTTDGEPCYLARHPELPGCLAHGDTPEEALENLDDARRMYLSALIESGAEIPPLQSTATGQPTPYPGVVWIRENLSNADVAAETPGSVYA